VSDSTRPKKSSVILAAAVLATLAGAQVATAQQATRDETTVLGEIVVTAQKREQKLQEVPIAVSVVSGGLIESTGGYNAESLVQLVPSLNIRKTNTQLNQALFLRGVGTINFAIAAQPSVAFVLDGVVLSSAGEAFGDMYDVERIEVLRGPQGTLFGKNASAGVVNVVSKKPGNEFGGYVDLGWYDGNEERIKAALDAPLSDTLRTRTTVTWGKYDGYIDNISTTPAGGKQNGSDRWGIRSIWVADPTDNVELTFIGDYRKSDDNCCVEVLGGTPSGVNALAIEGLLDGTDYLKGDKARKVKQNLVMTSKEEAWGLSAQADIGLGDYTLTSITAYRTWDSTEIREGDWLDQAAAYVGNAFAQLHDYGPQTQDTFSQELRIASPAGQSFNYVAGLYYAKTNAERYFRRDDIVCRASTLPVDPTTGQTPCSTTPGVSTIVTPSADATFGAHFTNFAAFADGTFNLSDSWRLIGGLRWTQDDLSYYHDYNFSPISGPGIRDQAGGGTQSLSGSNKSDEISGRAGLQFDLNDAMMAYATYARGYKGPAYNVYFNMKPADTAVIDAETADSYELGLKSTLLDGRMILNAAVFTAKYDNFQANNFQTLNGTVITTLTNAGSVTTDGVEVEFQARPTDNFNVGGGVSYTDAKIDKWYTPPGETPKVRDGTKLPLAPEWKASLNADYRIQLASFDIVPSLIYAYQSEQYSDLNEPAALRLPAYGTVDMSVAFQDKDGKYQLTLVGRNLTDQSFAALATAGGPAGLVRLQIPREADRYFGAQFRMNFGM
jgi:iron complex outermembrane receptor protein